METGISINKYIYSILSKDERLKELVGNKIYPLIAEESTTFPFIIFRKDNIITAYSKDGSVNDSVDFSIAIAATNYLETIVIAELVRTLLESKRTDYLKLVHFVGVYEDYVENTYIQELRFTAITQDKE